MGSNGHGHAWLGDMELGLLHYHIENHISD